MGKEEDDEDEVEACMSLLSKMADGETAAVEKKNL